MFQIGYTISIHDVGALDDEDTRCRLEENGSAVVGTITAYTVINDEDNGSRNFDASLSTTHVNINPTPGTALAYTVACFDEGGVGFNGAGGGTSNLWYIAYPPH